MSVNEEEPFNSLKQLESLTWEEFESFVVKVFNGVFRIGQESIKFEITSARSDGGKDAVAIFTISELTSVPVEFRMWMEAKQRKKSNVRHSDLNRTFIRSIIERIDRVFIVTNRDFTKGFKSDLDSLNRNSNAPFVLINGNQLLNLYQSVVGSKSSGASLIENTPKSIDLDIYCGLTIIPGDSQYLTQGELQIEFEESPYLVVSISSKSTATLSIELIIESPHLEQKVIVNSIFDSTSPLTYSFPLSSNGPDPIDISDSVSIKINSTVPVTYQVNCKGKVWFKPVFLKPTVLSSHIHAIESIDKGLYKFLNNGESQFYHLFAEAGVGKSFQVSRFKKKLIGKRVSILHISGDTIHGVDELVRLMLNHLLNISHSYFSKSRHSDLRRVLFELDYSVEDVDKLFELLNSTTNKESRVFNERHVGILVKVVINYVEKFKLAVLIDDLPKLGLTSRIVIQRLSENLLVSRVSNLLFFLTSRIDSSKDYYTSISQNREIQPLRLPKLNEADALDMLKASLPGVLPDVLRQNILPQVGFTPFAIKEAVAFLNEEGVIERTSANGEFALKNLDGLKLKIKSRALTNATLLRYHNLIEKTKVDQINWIDDFLLTGAILGKRFSKSLACHTLSIDTESLNDAVLQNLIEKDILKIPDHHGKHLEFTHDIIRDSILDYEQPERRIQGRHLVSKVLVRMDQGSNSTRLPNIKMGILKAINGEITSALEEFETYYQKSQSDGRFLDSAFSQLMTIQVTDYPLFQSLKSNTRFWDLIYLDSAFDKLFSSHEKHLINDKLLTHFMRALEGFIASGLGSNLGLDFLVSELYILARQKADSESIAYVSYYHGKLLFESADDYEASLKHHLECEEVLYVGRIDNRELMLDNSSRIFLCLRQLGRTSEADLALSKYQKLLSEGVVSEARVLTYKGYSLLYVNIFECFDYWEKALKLVVSEGNKERVIHYSIGVGYLSILLNKYAKSEECFELAEKYVNQLQKYTNRVRLLLNKANLYLVLGDELGAKEAITEAELLAINYGIFRRLWRVEATRATIEEIWGDPETASEYDSRSVSKLRLRINSENSQAWVYQRHALPILNILLRGKEDLINDLPKDSIKKIKKLVELIKKKKLKSLPGQLGFHIKELRPGIMRAVITE